MDKKAFQRKLRILKRKKWPVILLVLIPVLIAGLSVFSGIKKQQERFGDKPAVALSKVVYKKTDREKVKLIAHRGFSALAPENTTAALEKAGKCGYTEAEFDVRLTMDGVWVLSHDSDVGKMTDKSGKISSYTYYDLVTCNIDKGAHIKEYPGLKIPTLEQALEMCLKYNIRPMIEIKDSDDEGIEKLLAMLERFGLINDCSVISFDRGVLNKIREENENIELLALVSKFTEKEKKLFEADRSIGLSFNAENRYNSAGRIKNLTGSGQRVVCWTVDDGELMQQLIDMGFTDFVTNTVYPGK